MTATMYGVPNCDTIKRARTWLDEHKVAFTFHDYRKAGVPREALAGWIGEHGWETILNRAGTTFRKLPEDQRSGLDAEKAMTLMLAQPSMIKRPIVDLGDRRIVGYKPELYEAVFSGS